MILYSKVSTEHLILFISKVLKFTTYGQQQQVKCVVLGPYGYTDISFLLIYMMSPILLLGDCASSYKVLNKWSLALNI